MRPAIIVLLMLVPNMTGGEALALIAPLFFILAVFVMELQIRLERANQVNTEAHFMSLPKAPFSPRDLDHEYHLVAYRDDFVKVKLVQKHELTHNAALFIFQLPVKASLLMFPGHHIVLRSRIDDHLVIRPYSPVTSLVRFFGNGTMDNELMQSSNINGTIALAVKRYPNGAMSSWLHDSLSIGDTVEMMGPMGGYYYYPNEYDSIGLIAGGSGITPVLSVLMTALSNSEDETKFSLIYTNSSERDVIFRDELLQLSHKFPERFTLRMMNGSGRINRMVLREHLPRPSKGTQILICGPTGFATSVQKMLRGEKYADHSIFTFGESDK
jgi:ferredoxin-NADP reductase